MVSLFTTVAATIAVSLVSVSDAQSAIGPYFRPRPEFTSGVATNTDAPFRRSPCPAINTLANHGVIPRDGKNVTSLELRDAVQLQFNLELAFANNLVSALPAVFDLNLLGTHGFIEHDTSNAHADAYFGQDPSQVDPALLADLLSRASPSTPLDVAAMGKLRKDRLAACKAHNPNCTFGAKETRIALGEATLVLTRFGDVATETTPLARLEAFFADETFPSDWQTPSIMLTTAQVSATAAKISAAASV